METIALDIACIDRVLFKSYYVVWKLLPRFAIKNTGRTFKSYYVVWKPIPSLASKFILEQFKSYYVVWKRLSSCLFCVASAV